MNRVGVFRADFRGAIVSLTELFVFWKILSVTSKLLLVKYLFQSELFCSPYIDSKPGNF